MKSSLIYFVAITLAWLPPLCAGEVQKSLDPKLVAKFAERIQSKDWTERTEAVAELAKLLEMKREKGTDFGPVVEPLFKNAGWGGIARRNARTAEEALVRIGAPAKPLLRDRLQSMDAHDRRVAAELLARIGPPDIALTRLLIPLVRDRDSYVREAAIAGLGAVGPPAKLAVEELEWVGENDWILQRRVSARLALIQITGASDERVRSLALCLRFKEQLDEPGAKDGGAERGFFAAIRTASLLGDLGAKAKAAEPELRAAMKHPDAAVRSAATAALGRIENASRELKKEVQKR